MIQEMEIIVYAKWKKVYVKLYKEKLLLNIWLRVPFWYLLIKKHLADMS